MAIILSCQNISAQLTIPAGNTYTGTSFRPLCGTYGYDRIASYYEAADIGIVSGSTIKGIRYFVQSTHGPGTIPTKIYMANASGMVAFSQVYFNAISGATLVYNASIPSTNFTAGRWIYIPLSTPFVFTGSGLQVIVETNAASSTEPSDGKLFRTSAGNSQTWSSFSTPINPNTAYGTPVGFKPNMQIFYDTPGYAGNISFDHDQEVASENTMATVTVNRNGGSAGVVSVNYATNDGTAIAGLDYTSASGTLTWADGDSAPKTISVPILSDYLLDNGETIALSLSSPVGTTITNVNPATITITDVLPPMIGTYTVGTGGNYTSLTNAGGIFQALNTRISGVSGPITINIISDLTAETGNFALNEIVGGHSVLIQPYGGSRTVTGALSTTANLGLIRFEGTDNVTINGSLVGAEAGSCQIGGDASLRQLTIINNSVGTTAAVLFQSSTTGAYNNTIKNVNLVGYSPSVGYGAMFRVFPHSSSVPSLVNNQNSRVANCSVKKASIGIYSAGSTTSNPNTNLVVTGNDISATGTDRVSRNAIFIVNETNPQVTFNKVNIMNTTTDSSETVGLAIGASQAYATSVTSGGISGALVANNWITGVVSTVDLGGSTAGIAISGTAFGTPNIVKNNMISNVSGLSQFTYNVAGIWVVGAVASETKLYHNTISLYGDRGARTNQSPSYGIAISGLDPSVEMRNNIISTTQIATGGGFVKTYAFGTLSTTFANLVSDNNVFYSAGAQDGGFRSGSLSNNAGTSYANLADWTAATLRDTHSVEVAPVFVAATDLHLVPGSNPIIQSTPGSPLASVTTDFDCNPRSATSPAIGAQEIDVIGYSISAVAGTGGTITPEGNTSIVVGGNQSYTISANCGYIVSDVLVDGVSQGAITSYTFSNVNASHTISVTYTAQMPTITAAGSTTLCTGGSVVLTSSSSTGNVWSTGETTQSITAQASGNYFVAVNNGTCNSPQSLPISITIIAPATAPTITANNSLTFCQGGSVTLTSSALTGNLWSNGATTRAITVTTSGTYSVIYNNGGCDSAPSAGSTVTVNPLPATPTISASGSTTLCTGGNVVLTSSAATGNTWSNGATTQSITVSANGTFSVTAVSGGCTSAASAITTVTVNTIPARPTIAVTGATTFCEGGSVTLTSSATTGNLWSNGETTQAIIVTTGGVYTVASTVNGCTSTTSLGRTITVNAPPAVPTITATGSTTFCTGGNVVLTSSSATGNTWSNGAITQSITVSTAGTYTVTAATGTCTSAASAGTTVTVNAIPSTPTITATGSTTFCAGGSVVLTSSSATGNLWSTNETTQSITVSTGGTYTVTVTNDGCSSATSAGTTVTVGTQPVLTITNPAAVCTPNTVDITVSAVTAGSVGGGTLTYWTDAAATISLASPNAIATGGTYYIKSTVGSCSDTQPVVVTLVSTPTLVVTNPVSVCAPNTVDITLPNVTAGSVGGGTLTYWTNAATTNALSNPTAIAVSGTYYIKTSFGTCSDTRPVVVTINPLPSTPTISAGSATTFCTGGSVVLTSSSATGNRWSTNETTQSITVSAGGTYTVAVINSGCTSATSAGTEVTVNAIPTTPTISAGGATTFCSGGNVVLTSSSATGNLWSTDETTQSITVSTGGTYTLAVTNSGCTSATSAGTEVTVNATPSTPTISAGGATTFCSGGSVVLTSSSATGNLWSTNETTQSITVSTGGTYTVAVTNSGCTSATSAGTEVTVNAIPSTPTISAGGATTFCTGDSVVLTSSSATGNLWSTNETTQSITVSAGGTYTVAVTNSGCTSATSAGTTVTVNALPNGEITQNLGIITATQSGATYQWYMCPNTLIVDATNQTYTPIVVGDYKVEVTLGSCSVTSDCITVTTLGNSEFDLNRFDIYPNPVVSVLNIDYTSEFSDVAVFNMLGQLVLTRNVNANNTQIDMSRLPSGTYLIKITAENVSKTVKVIKK